MFWKGFRMAVILIREYRSLKQTELAAEEIVSSIRTYDRNLCEELDQVQNKVTLALDALIDNNFPEPLVHRWQRIAMRLATARSLMNNLRRSA